MRILEATWLFLIYMPCLAVGMTNARRDALREETKDLFKHGYEGYMKYAYPADELRTLSCGPSHRDPDPSNYGINDVHANVSMTLLDVLSSLPLIHPTAFPNAVQLVATRTSFDQNVKIQVFELTIRAMASLLSTYQYLDGLPDSPKEQARNLGIKGKVDVKKYKERMLELALDLGKRLIPAFDTPTGLPYSRVNLRYGVEKGESVDTCAAGAGSLVLEFSVLSRLTGDDMFEILAERAYLAVWNRRSQHNLVANTIGVTHGQWLLPGMSGVGAGMDSFFEYGMKAAILLGDDAYLDMFQDAYAAIQTHVRTIDGFIYRPIQYRLLHLSNPSTIDALSAFISGLQVLSGDLESAIRSHLIYWNLWRRYSAMPENWSWINRKVEWTGYPGRPEFFESTYYLYQATKDPFYLRVGERILKDVKERTMTKCGFATMKNVETGELEDRMESFVLSEGLKYLYLLFDSTPKSRPTNQVHTTEGHTLSLPFSHLRPPSAARRKLNKGENQYCPKYKPPMLGGGLVVGIEQREDYEYARSLVFGPGVDGRAEEDGQVFWSEYGVCRVPIAPRFMVEIVLSPHNESSMTPPEDPSPSPSKVWRDEDTGNFVITDVSGLRLSVRWRLDNKGYDVATIGPHRVRPGQNVIVTDPQMEGYLPVPPDIATHQPAEVLLRFSTLSVDGSPQVFLHAIGATATFGREVGKTDGEGWGLGGGPVRIIRPSLDNLQGCSPFSMDWEDGGNGVESNDFVILVDRGDCTFAQKLWNGQHAGAAGILVTERPTADDLSAQNVFEVGGLMRPSGDGESEKVLHELKGVGMVFTASMVGEVIKKMMKEKLVGVEMIRLDWDMSGMGDMETESGMSGSDGGGGGGVRREGRLALGDWEIWNLRIVERPP